MSPCLSFVALTAVTLAMARGSVTLAAAVAWYFFLTLCSSLLLVFQDIHAERQGALLAASTTEDKRLKNPSVRPPTDPK